jgi:hypothetical protein
MKKKITQPLAYFINFHSMPILIDEHGTPLSAFGFLRRMPFSEPVRAFQLVKVMRRLKEIWDEFEETRLRLAEQYGVLDILEMRSAHPIDESRQEAWQAFERAMTELVTTPIEAEVLVLVPEDFSKAGKINAFVLEMLEPWLDDAAFGVSDGVQADS